MESSHTTTSKVVIFTIVYKIGFQSQVSKPTASTGLPNGKENPNEELSSVEKLIFESYFIIVGL